jgi:predicted ATP-dependent protease
MSQPAVEANLSRALHEIGQIEAEAAEKLDVLRHDVAGQVLERQLSPIRSQARAAGYEDAVADFLDAMRADVLDHLELFFQESVPGGPSLSDPAESDPAVRYGVNVLVENDPEVGAPVEILNLPTIPNLVGRIEHQVYAGALVTHPGLIRAGALHRANGGFLIIDATEFLDFPEAWVALKRALKTGEVRFEASDGMQPGIMTTEGIDPEPIPLDIKVILQGPDWIYHWIFSEDDDFYELFKVKADFDCQMDRTPENEMAYARFVAARCTEEKFPPFEAGAVARLVDYGSWLVEDQAKLSARFSDMADIIRESVYHAQKQNPQPEAVTAADVDAALDAREFRSNLAATATWEEIRRGQIYIDTEGEVIGQVNGLTIYDDGHYAFGQPTRITARTYMGREGVNQIDREVDLSGPIHNKGVLTLRGYLGGHYAQRKSLALSASITFEQTYGPIDGDSAASAELYALLSSLAQLPIKQGIGVTGSVNQLGQVQPIGGVSAKIEGFFEICKSRGLTGDQGVLIPRTNITNLSLKDEVIEAVEAGLFTIYAIDTVEEGIELLTGVPAGSNLSDGTIHQIVFKRLEEMANEDSSSHDGDDEEDEDEEDEE